MASTLKINNLDTASGTTITIPTGKQLIGTDTNSIKAPGQIINVTGTVYTTVSSTTSSSYSTLFSHTITPTSTSSKIFIVISIGGLYTNLAASANQSHWRIGRSIGGASDDVPVNHNTNFHTEIGRNLTGAGTRANVDMTTLDSPNTTSAVVYKVQCRIFTGSNGIQINDTQGTSTMTLFEIAQ